MVQRWDDIGLRPERRRAVRPLGARLREYVWPRSGWIRSSKYLAYKLARASGTPAYVATGFGAGVAMAFTPFLGAHLALALLIALALRGSMVAAFVGTFVGNPWTYPFIWIASYEIGALVLPGTHPAHPEFVRTLANLVAAVLTFDLHRFAERVWPTFFPMMVGGMVLAVVGGPAAFWLSKWAIEKWQAHRRARIAHRKERPTPAE